MISVGVERSLCAEMPPGFCEHIPGEAVPCYRAGSAERCSLQVVSHKDYGAFQDVNAVLCTSTDCSRLCTLLIGAAPVFASSA